jgi:hypothetical protein
VQRAAIAPEALLAVIWLLPRNFYYLNKKRWWDARLFVWFNEHDNDGGRASISTINFDVILISAGASRWANF